MTEDERTFHTYRILAHYTKCEVRGQTFVVSIPTPEILYEAERKYREFIDDELFNGWIRKDNLESLLIRLDIIGPLFKDRYKKLEKEIDKMKVKYFKTFLGQPRQHQKVKIDLKLAKEQQTNMYNKLHCLDHITLEGWGEVIKQRFIYLHTTHTEGGAPLLTEDGWLIDQIRITHNNNKLNVEEYREMARTDPWKVYWNSRGEQCFEGPLDDERIMMILFSKMYDNAREHSDCPKDSIIEDNDAFDGWMIYNRQQKEKDQIDKHLEVANSTYGRKMTHNPNKISANDGEFFSMASTPNDAQEIYELNSLNSRATIQARQQTIQKFGKDGVAESKMPDVQRELLQHVNRSFKG
jgi:hypothetical protein